MSTSNSGDGRLNSFFRRVLAQGAALQPKQSRIFLQALAAEPDPTRTLEKLWSSGQGKAILRSALSSQTSVDFLNNEVVAVLSYLQDPYLKAVQGGSFLQDLLWYITANPPYLWDALVREFRSQSLSDKAISAFAWLLLELLSLPESSAQTFRQTASDQKILQLLLGGERRGLVTNYRKIKFLIDSSPGSQTGSNGDYPGWRHDNDKQNIREIAILPTAEELRCSEKPFLRRAYDVAQTDTAAMFATHIDNQFRLLREDMIRDLSEELQLLRGKGTRKRSGLIIHDLSIEGVKAGQIIQNKSWSLQLRCNKDIPGLPPTEKKRREYIDDTAKRFLRHESLCCILLDKTSALALAYIDRDEDLLMEKPPIVCIRLEGGSDLEGVLQKMKQAKMFSLIQLNTAVFAYAPILRQLQKIRWLTLGEEIVASETATQVAMISPQNQDVLEHLERKGSLSEVLKLKSETVLDPSQKRCFKAAISQRISLIQGPPGTGKSFIGALIAKSMYLHTSHTILVVCYKNHMLDQFLEDLMTVGVPADSMVRIGAMSKTSATVQSLNLMNQLKSRSPRTANFQQINRERDAARTLSVELTLDFSLYNQQKLSIQALKREADIDLDHPQFCSAFDVPNGEDGMTRVDRKGKAVDEFYLFTRWGKGQDAGIFPDVALEHSAVWEMSLESRKGHCARWKNGLLAERAARVAETANSLDKTMADIARLRNENVRELLQSKRIIGCTTTGAAKYVHDIQTAKPGVVLVEEAGEILESHVLTALGPDTEQLILIGDHQQLRPKVHYDLSVARGDGYDLDISLFERLIIKGHPHQTLSLQHRMRPEISMLVKHLTYPNLKDADSTLARPRIRGLQKNVVFIDHKHMEDDIPEVRDTRDVGSGSSKKNSFEAQMTLKIVKYLGQQGYGSGDIVVLTPYLAQLKLMTEELAKDNDPVLNDLDSHDLVRAGLMPAPAAKSARRRLRVSSIDNYQGEQSDLVIISLTRSNPRGDIGFMVAPERLNVLLSRAKNGMVILGNSETFLRSPKGKDLWQRLCDGLVKSNMFFDGLPVECAQHPDKKLLLRTPEDFELHCPDGGCNEPCDAILQCGKHQCPQKCHQLSDHSKMGCDIIVDGKCSLGHNLSSRCSDPKPSVCTLCERRKAHQEHLLKLSREAQAQADNYDLKISVIEDELEELQNARVEQSRVQESAALLKQKKADLEQTKRLAAKERQQFIAKMETQTQEALPKSKKPRNPRPDPQNPSKQAGSLDVEIEWERLKQSENASNIAMDKLMALTGLEKVKKKFFSLHEWIGIANRQGLSLDKERLGICLLGNPGTGKTTVARLYGQFLSTTGMILGTQFKETTGSRLANDGVSGAQKLLEDIKKAGGGVLFIDEAYQLASGHSSGGVAVLDFLLAEIENLTGKVVFVLAGYNKQMENFFQHNQGFASRIPSNLQFDDYSDTELLAMLEQKLHLKYNGRMEVEDGNQGLYCRIAIRRMARGRGTEGFGNARALENMLSAVAERQVVRISRERQDGRTPDYFLFTKEDVIGPEPSAALRQCDAWTELQQMIGLQTVKESLRGLLDQLSTNYQRELAEKSIVETSLNRVFLGSPGTGKTSVAKLYGQILKDIGCLSNGEVIMKNPSDFIGSVLGESEKNTKAILESAKGKVLIIDEAYMLHTSNEAGQSTSDPYKIAVVDTIVAEVQSTPGEDQCVLLLGYREQLERMFRDTNPGLSRRFPLADAFHFEDFSDDELQQILDLKLRKHDLFATKEAKEAAMEVLKKARWGLNFGNGGEVENVITRAKNNYQARFKSVLPSERPLDITFEPEDFDPDFGRSKDAMNSFGELFSDMVGCDDVVMKLQGYTRACTNMRARGLDPCSFIPFNFIFKGPPGTGKTTTARKMGQVYYNMGLLASNNVVECSATDLIGQYVGQTGPKTTNQLEQGLGKVLFIDEAYRLGEGHFATEAINELVDNLTKPRFQQKLIVILAGYEDAMNRLLTVNQGLASRFPEEVVFQNMAPEQCLKLLLSQLQKSQVQVDSSDKGNIPAILSTFEDLSKLRGWGNGRDVANVAASIAAEVIRESSVSSDQFTVDYADVARHLKQSLQRGLARERPQLSKLISPDGEVNLPVRTRSPPNLPQTSQKPSIITTTAVRTETDAQAPTVASHEPPESVLNPSSMLRDAGVSDEVWDQLQRDQQAQKILREQLDAQIAEHQQEFGDASRQEEKLRKQIESQAAQKGVASIPSVDPEVAKAKRAHELARLERIKALQALRKAELERKQEEMAQQKLQRMGVCPVGFRWIKQASGYRCAGGSHFVSDNELK